MRASLVALILGEMAFVAFVLWLAAGFVRDRTRQRAELQARLIERLGSAQEVIAFLASDTGRSLERALTGGRDGQTRQILATVQLGIVLIATGTGLGLAESLRANPDLATWALACAATGTGLLVAAAVSRRLSRAWAAQERGEPRG